MKQPLLPEIAYQTISAPSQGDELIVESNAYLNFEAGREVKLQDGFFARRGGEVLVNINPEWETEMNISLISYPTDLTVGEEYKIRTKNADSWEFCVEKRASDDTTIVFQSAGIIRSDMTIIWNISNELDYGIFYCKLALKNSYGRRLEKQSVIRIQQPVDYDYTNGQQQNEDIVQLLNDYICLDTTQTDGLYPNPTDGQVTVVTGGEVQSIVIYTADGRPVGGWKILSLSGDHATLDVSSLPGGLYLLAIRTADATTTHKLTVRK